MISCNCLDVTENTTKLINGLATASQMLKNKEIKSLRANIDYKINGQYRDIKTMYCYIKCRII